MKFLQANPDLLTQARELAVANPVESFFLMTALLMVACWKLKDSI